MSESAWDRAIEAFHDGDLLQAEQILRDAVAAAEGAGGPAFAEACFHLASMLGGMGDHAAGAEALRRAVAAELPGDEGERDRLTYLMNLGEFLTRAGDLDAAGQALLDGLDGREAFYGADHPGYAFGLEPLAEVRLLEGDAETALALFDQCLHIFWQHGHPRVTTALAGRAFALAQLGQAALFEPAEQLPDELMGEVIDAALQRVKAIPGPTALAVLTAIVALAEARRPSELRRIRAAEANAARAIGASERRIAALTALEPLSRTDGERIDVLQGLAMALEEAGDHPRAEQVYVQAVVAAEELADPGFLSRTQRNAGLYLAENGRRGEARRLLVAAVDVARSADLLPELGRGLIALGIFDQHDGDLEPAEVALREGITLLPPEDRDRLCGVSHLDAIETEGGCGCGDMGGVLARALEALIKPQLPDGLLEGLTVQTTDAGPTVDVQLAREADEDELRRLDQLIKRGLAQLQSDD